MNRDQRLPQRSASRGRSAPPPEPITPRPMAQAPSGAVEDERPVPAAAPADPRQGGRKAVYTIIESGGGNKSRWVRIGIAFVNRDGSYNVVLDALPVTGTLHIRDFPPREGEGAEEE